MTRLIGLPQEFEKIAAAEAQKHGKSLEEYLLKLIAGALTPQALAREQSSEDCAAHFQHPRRWAESSRDTRNSRTLMDA